MNAAVRAMTARVFMPALLLSAVYPTLFALSHNWYVLDWTRIALLLALSVAIPLLIWSAIATMDAALSLSGNPSAERVRRTALPGIMALASAAVLYVLMQGTLEAAAGRAAGLAVAAAMTALTWFLFARGKQGVYTLVLAGLAVVSGVQWVADIVAAKTRLAKQIGSLPEVSAWPSYRFTDRPNIWLVIYDAYASGEAYSREFGFDNSPQLRYLQDLGFSVINTFSNYQATWPTTLSLFLGSHHYYQLVSGVDDSSVGRAVMAGLAPNPVLQTLRSNGYRVQYVHGMEYFTSEQGVVDFVHPAVSFRSALSIYQSPALKLIAGGEQRRLREQEQVLIERLPAPPSAAEPPWFSFVHVALPGHSPLQLDWRQLASFEETFRKRTRAANRHMRRLIARILERDPDSLIIILGDHGAWRWRKAWTLDPDPNRSFEMAGIASGIATLDLFGITLAVHSGGRCDDRIYPALTPVNLMPAIFGCLSGGDLPDVHVGDFSVFGSREKYITQRDGRILARWEPLERH